MHEGVAVYHVVLNIYIVIHLRAALSSADQKKRAQYLGKALTRPISFLLGDFPTCTLCGRTDIKN